MFFLCLLALLPRDPVRVSLTPSPIATKEALRWSPKGATVKLRVAGQALQGSFPLGPKNLPEIVVELSKKDASRFNQLWVDANRDGKRTPDELLETAPTERTGKWWSSFGPISVPIPTADNRTSRPYPINLWFVEDPQEPGAAPTLRWSRRGWHEGQVLLEGKPAFVLITEMQMDGVFDQRDAWMLSRTREGILGSSSRGLEDHVWLDGAAYRPTAIDPEGASLRFERFDPGITEAEETGKRDIFREDKAAPKAATPVAFLHNFEEAAALAKKTGKRLFVDFETTWCGPCKSMDSLVYSQLAVVEAAQNVVRVKVDGDLRRDLTKKLSVAAYPTMILLDSSGKELRRAVGYQRGTQLVEFLAKR
ncbi:thioredoxin family protein [Armatimonas sp.]|uniref:thioredoxin family protein n=1 Tax=Armatimonas sp. TaxID=1872638 RepID=UPI00286A3496|nr:thioredoxin family protein [Armatimonas sp.]